MHHVNSWPLARQAVQRHGGHHLTVQQGVVEAGVSALWVIAQLQATAQRGGGRLRERITGGSGGHRVDHGGPPQADGKASPLVASQALRLSLNWGMFMVFCR